MKPFNLKDALEGARVVTRSLHTVEQIKKFDIGKLSGDCLAGVCRGVLRTWRLDGRYGDYSESDYDLFMAPIKHTGWANIYATPREHNACIGGIYPSRDAADKGVRRDDPRVACVQIEWEE